MNLFTLVLQEWTGVALDTRGVATFVADDSAAKRHGLKAGAHLLRANGKDISNAALEEIMEFLQRETNRPLTLIFSQPGEGSKVRATGTPRVSQN